MTVSCSVVTLQLTPLLEHVFGFINKIMLVGILALVAKIGDNFRGARAMIESHAANC